MTHYIQTALSNKVFTISLNRVEAENALIPEQLAELIEIFSGLRTNQHVHAVVLQSNSSAFSIGGDMHGFNRHFPDIRDYAIDIVGKLNQMILAMIDLPQPIVTAVQGIVTGGSMGFVLASDLVLVAPQVQFKAHYPTAGFSPDGGWGVLLPRLIGARRAAGCLFLNKSFDAQQAVDWGIANAIVEPENVRDEAQKCATKIAAYPSGTMRYSKQLLWRERAQIAVDLEQELEKFVDLITRDEAQGLVRKFLQTYTEYPTEKSGLKKGD